ncbi:MAG: VWA-like domain-containing protein [Cyanobacteriota bacterium]|nr:VWA-like domain-containing protein [Cyanobacteriota bacterium]
MTNDIDLERFISASLLRLRVKSPFFATLALFSRFHPTTLIPTAATDGKDIFYNPDFLAELPPAQIDGVLLHEVLHAALLHVIRRGARQPQLWNIAADIVVNGAIAELGHFTLPPSAIRDSELEDKSVEEIYELLIQNPPKNGNCILDLLSEPPSGTGEKGQGEESLKTTRKAELEAYWKAAIQQAITIARASEQQGSIPARLRRELGTLTEPQLDWRSYLWRYLVRTPNDFSGFDRRFIGRGLYLETLEGESVRVFVAIDTSGSISDRQMRTFLGETCGILRAYPHLEGTLFYADAKAYGPYPLESDSTIPTPVGGGGTSFVPFFERVAEMWDGQDNAVCVYLTDGYGTFPPETPELPVLWVVTAGGLDLKKFPFGETVRLLETL